MTLTIVGFVATSMFALIGVVYNNLQDSNVKEDTSIDEQAKTLALQGERISSLEASLQTLPSLNTKVDQTRELVIQMAARQGLYIKSASTTHE